MLKWVDLPPVWLGAFAVAVWLTQGWASGGGTALAALGTGLVAGALVVMVLAILEMRRGRTTVIPHMAPAALVTTGPFARSRNPIYLADAMILAGLSLRWEAPLGLLLVPVFMALIQTRFIRAEEARLAAAFPDDFDRYAAATRRWI